MHHHHNHTTMPNTLPITLSNSLHHYHDYTLHNHYTVHDTLPIALSSNMHHHYHNPMHHHHNHTTMPNTLHITLYNALFLHFPHHNCTCEGLCTLPKVSSL